MDSKTTSNPLDYIHQVAVHQLRHAAEDVEDGGGLVADFDYDEEIVSDIQGDGITMTAHKERIVTLEVSYILPE